MKNLKCILLLVLCTSIYGFSQRISEKVGNNPTLIHPSAALEVESTTKGLLPPRMTSIERNAIVSPAAGLLVYCTNCGLSGELQVFNGSTWTNAVGGTVAPALSVGVPTSTGGTLVFMTHNLGADTTADPLTPSWRLNGAYFQWGKKPVDTNGDGYRTKANNGPEGFAAAPTGPGAAEANNLAVPSWSTTQVANDAWNVNEASPVKTANDPCPSGYRVPTWNEWTSILFNNMWGSAPSGGTWSDDGSYNSGKLYNNSLYFPAAGMRSYYDGVRIFHNQFGYYWSSTFVSSNDTHIYIATVSQNGNVDNSFNKIYAIPIRCVAE